MVRSSGVVAAKRVGVWNDARRVDEHGHEWKIGWTAPLLHGFTAPGKGGRELRVTNAMLAASERRDAITRPAFDGRSAVSRELRSGRRRRWTIHPDGQADCWPRIVPQLSRGRPKRGGPEEHRIPLQSGSDEFLFSFLTFACLHRFAQVARMFAIERFLDGLGKTPVLRVADEHLGPGKSLERRPMQSDACAQGEHDEELTESEQRGVHR